MMYDGTLRQAAWMLQTPVLPPIVQPSKKAQSHHIDVTQLGLYGANP